MTTTFRFRRIALDRLSSADDLDRVLRVTSLRSWILVAALCGLTVTALVTAVLQQVRDEAVRITGDKTPAVALSHPAGWGPVRRLV